MMEIVMRLYLRERSARQITVGYDGASGRIASADIGGIAHTWSYLEGSDLKSRLDYGTIGSAEWSYESNRDLLTQVKNSAHGSVISQYDYTNDAAGRRVSKNNERYGYNERSELISATGNGNYSYVYDDIGNRISSSEPENSFAYTANSLNQYTGISAVNLNLEPQPFIPQYDLDGNQTLIKTKTGIWSVTYNGENRPIDWTCGATNIVMKYDRMGRRVEYLETVYDLVDSTITTNKHQHFVYDNYLCVERLDASNTNAVTDVFVWDPTEPIATRPLQWQTPTDTYAYFHDGNKNVTDVMSTSSETDTIHNDYAPFGMTSATAFGEANPWRFSSEYRDDMLCLAYYNYRHYDLSCGRWLSRDPFQEEGGLCIYSFCVNKSADEVDVRGELPFVPVVLAKAIAYAIAALTAYQTTACYQATVDLESTESDAYRHCYVSCAYSKCMEGFSGKYLSQLMTLIGGLAWEVWGSLQKDGSFSLDDLKSDLIGVVGSLDYSSCEEPCECEKGKYNPK